MTYTCTSCHDLDCEKVGQDLRACEHHVRLSDVEPEPEPAVPTLPLNCPFFDHCEDIVSRLRSLERAVHDIGRAVRGELL